MANSNGECGSRRRERCARRHRPSRLPVAVVAARGRGCKVRAVRTRALRASQVSLAISVVLLVLVYFWDLLSLRLQHQPSWCIDHYGTPARFAYLLPDRAERVGAGVTDFWGWLPPGVSCTFTYVLTKESETVTPPADRSYLVVVLVAMVLISTAGIVVARRKR